MADEWFYVRSEGHRLGPVPFSELQALARTGPLLPADLVWQQGMLAWKAASTVEGLTFSSTIQAALPVLRPEPALGQDPSALPPYLLLFGIPRSRYWRAGKYFAMLVAILVLFSSCGGEPTYLRALFLAAAGCFWLLFARVMQVEQHRNEDLRRERKQHRPFN